MPVGADKILMRVRMGVGEQFDSVLDAAKVGAEWAFAVLYRDLNPRLLRYFKAQAPAVAEDLASETWLAAARQLPRFEGDERAFRGWLFTIAHGRLVQHWRDSKRRPFQPVDPHAVPDSAISEPGRPAGVDIEADVVEAAMAQEAVRRLTEELSRDQAEVVLLRVLAGLDVDQVASILGKRAGAVRVLQHKALRRLAGKNFSLEGVTP